MKHKKRIKAPLKKLHKSSKPRTRRKRAIRRRHVLCRSFLSKMWTTKSRFRAFKRKYRYRKVPNLKVISGHVRAKKEFGFRSRVSLRFKGFSRLHAVTPHASFSSSFQRVKKLRTRRLRLNRKTLFRSNIHAPSTYLRYYVLRAPYAVELVCNHIIHTFRRLFIRLVRCRLLTRRKHIELMYLLGFLSRMVFRIAKRMPSRSSLVFFRHSYMSLFSFGGCFNMVSKTKYTYFQLLKNNKFLVTNTFGQRFQQRISNSFNLVCSFVTFLFKFFYIYFTFRFLTLFGLAGKHIYSESFYLHILHMFVSIRKTNKLYFSRIFSGRRIRVSFFRFLLGNYSNRMPFFLFRISSNVSVFFLIWFLNMYKSLLFSIFFCSIKYDFVMFILLSSISNKRNNTRSLGLFLLIIKLSTLFYYCRSFFLSIDSICTHSFSIQSYILFKYRMPSYMYSVCSHLFNFVMHFRIYRLHGGLNRFLKIKAIRNFLYQVEHTFFSSNNSQHFFFAKFYYKSIPPLTSAKLVCDSMLISLSIGYTIRKSFNCILYWQKYWQSYYDNNTVPFFNRYKLNLGNYVYPLKGIRISCAGPSYKARRTTTAQYHLWVSNDFITGRMPLSQVNLQIDYFQTVVVLRRSNIGLKIWVLFDAVL